MGTNHGKITDFEVTQSGDIWIDVDEDIFYDIKYSDWESVCLYPNTKSIVNLLPEWYNWGPDPGYNNIEIDAFDWLKRVVICCKEHTKPIETLHQIYLFIEHVEICYTGEMYEDEVYIMHNCVEIGDEGWENFYYIHIYTSPRSKHSLW